MLEGELEQSASEGKKGLAKCDWELGFRARSKAIALANEVSRDLVLEITPGSDGPSDVLPRPVLVAGEGGWISSSPGTSDLLERQPMYRHLRTDEIYNLRQSTSMIEIWG